MPIQSAYHYEKGSIMLKSDGIHQETEQVFFTLPWLPDWKPAKSERGAKQAISLRAKQAQPAPAKLA